MVEVRSKDSSRFNDPPAGSSLKKAYVEESPIPGVTPYSLQRTSAKYLECDLNEVDGLEKGKARLHTRVDLENLQRSNIARFSLLKPSPKCPECNSSKVFKNGTRYTARGEVQRFICRVCEHRFSDPSNLKTVQDNYGSNQVCVSILQEKTKNLDTATETKTVAGEGEKQTQTPGLIVEFQWKMKKRGLADPTIINRGSVLKHLTNFGADLMKPESVETILATETYTRSMKYATVNAYKVFCRYYKIDWEPVKTPYQPEEIFIPLEEEITCLIAACGKRTSAFLQTLKDTGARTSEVKHLKWTDINEKDNTISINQPGKGSNSRTVEVPVQTIAVLKNLPKTHGEYIFSVNGTGVQSSFRRKRREVAAKLQNPRLLKIHFHTLRHWRATMEYSKTREIYAVKQLLGHKSLKSTDRYQHMVKFPHEEYISKVARTIEEAQELLNAGFRFECDYGTDGKIFIRRK